jgi:hypothetical protein
VPVPPGTGNGGGIVLGTPGNGYVLNTLIGTNNDGSNDAAEGNIIAGNGSGIVITSNTATGNTATSNIVAGNRIFSNTGPGIDLNGDGVTFNHSGVVAGPNDYQNYPKLSGAHAGDNG